jgi:hypothetical protein
MPAFLDRLLGRAAAAVDQAPAAEPLIAPGPAHREERNTLRLARLEQQIQELEQAGLGNIPECVELKKERARTKMLLGDYSDVIRK